MDRIENDLEAHMSDLEAYMSDLEEDENDDLDLSEYQDNLVMILLLHSIYKEIEEWQATIIQRAYRRYIMTYHIRKNIHKRKSIDYLWDIVEFSYAPPQKSELPLLKMGGYQYRWAKDRFNLNKYR